jgi:flagellar protein FlbD
MITLHRLGHKLEIFRLNPDLIVTVEATPDTVITLATGAKIVVAETPERVVAEVRAYRVDILAGALRRRHELRADGLAPHAHRGDGSASRAHVRLAHSNADQPQTGASA